MKNKTLLYLLLFLALGAGSVWLLSSQDEGKSTYNAWERDFKVEQTDEIQKIFLADRKGNTTQLEREGDHWIYNGKYRANPNVVGNLLEVIRLVEIKYIPPQAAIEPMVKDLATQGIKVEIYGAADKLLKAYYVGGTTADERGTFMIMDGSDMPYVTSIPIMEGGLRVRYAVKGDQWRDKTVFGYDPEMITYVSVEYPKQKSKSFVLERAAGGYSVKPYFDVTPPSTTPYRQGSAENYLTGFQRVIAEAFENQNPLRDTITQRVPFCVIELRTSDGNARKFTFHPVTERNSPTNAPIPVIESYLVDIEPDGDFVLLQHNLVKQILRPYEHFF